MESDFNELSLSIIDDIIFGNSGLDTLTVFLNICISGPYSFDEIGCIFGNLSNHTFISSEPRFEVWAMFR